MSTTIILPSNEQKTLYTDFLHSAADERKRILKPLQNTAYQYNSTTSPNSFFTKNSTWEYFSNELEFE